MRDTIISVVDAFSYLVSIILTILGIAIGASVGGVWVVLGGIVGFVVGSFTCGTWLALSGIYWKLGNMPEK